MFVWVCSELEADPELMDTMERDSLSGSDVGEEESDSESDGERDDPLEKRNTERQDEREDERERGEEQIIFLSLKL